jgi:hypothetical protein
MRQKCCVMSLFGKILNKGDCLLQWHMLYPERHGSREEKLSEFNPEKDSKNKTLHLMKAIVETFYGEPR